MKPLALIAAGAIGLQLLLWAFAPRPPEDTGTLARLDSARIAAEHRAAAALADLQAARAETEAAVAVMVQREQKAREKAAQASHTARTSGAKVAALLDSLGASTEAWDTHLAADSAVVSALEEERDTWRERAGLWERRATLAELAAAAEHDAHEAANLQLAEALDRLGSAEKRTQRAERSARLWKIGAGVGVGVALASRIGG